MKSLLTLAATAALGLGALAPAAHAADRHAGVEVVVPVEYGRYASGYRPAPPVYAVPAPAYGYPAYERDRAWREHEWRERAWREHERRDRERQGWWRHEHRDRDRD